MNGMRVDSAVQAARLLYACAFGAGAYLLYLVQTRLNRRGRVLAGLLLDAGYWLVTLGAFVLLILGCCGGELRLYHLCGIGAGASAAGIAVMRRNKEKS